MREACVARRAAGEREKSCFPLRRRKRGSQKNLSLPSPFFFCNKTSLLIFSLSLQLDGTCAVLCLPLSRARAERKRREWAPRKRKQETQNSAVLFSLFSLSLSLPFSLSPLLSSVSLHSFPLSYNLSLPLFYSSLSSVCDDDLVLISFGGVDITPVFFFFFFFFFLVFFGFWF